MCRAPTAFWKRPRRGPDKPACNRHVHAYHAGMWFLNIFQGLSAGLRIQDSGLYRHPYRNGNEAFRGDAKRIAQDITISLEKFDE